MKKLTETQLRILERLNDYRFLTAEQMQKMGIAKHIHTIYSAIRGLRKGGKPYVDIVEFGTQPEIGRLPRLTFLTKYGAELLAEALQYDPEEIKHPKGKIPSYRDLTHRLHTIDLHILARSFCEAHEGVELDYFQSYFEHKGANNWGDPRKPRRQAVNKIELAEGRGFVPDCIFKITDPTGKPHLFTGEIYRNHNTKRTHNQLRNHLESLKLGSISTLYNYSRAVPVLVLCEQQGAMTALQNRLKDDPAFEKTEDYFLFRTLEPVVTTSSQNADTKTIRTELTEAFALGWQTYTGKKKVLFH